MQTAIARGGVVGDRAARGRRAAAGRGTARVTRQVHGTRPRPCGRRTRSCAAGGADLLNAAARRHDPRPAPVVATPTPSSSPTPTRWTAPIVHAMRGKEFIEHDNPFDVGMTGLLGFSSGYLAMKDCDTLLMLGTDFPYQQFFPQKATIIQVDLRGEQLGRRTRLDLGLVGDVKTTLAALMPRLDAQDRSRAPQGVARALPKAREGPRRTGDRRAGRDAASIRSIVAKTLRRPGRRTTPSSPATSARRPCGRRAI